MSSRLDGAPPDATAEVSDTVGVTDAAPGPEVANVKDVPADFGVGKEVAIWPEVPPGDMPPTKDVAGGDASDGPAADLPDGRNDGIDARDAGTVMDLGLGVDLGAVCTPGMDQTCNDSELTSSIWGGCTANGTCICKGGFEINPATGRCRLAPRDAAPDTAALACTGEFDACGCTCCDGTTPTSVCYYPTLGETTTALRAADEQVRQSTNCEMAGCSLGKRYVCCAPGTPEPTGSASYTADGYIGGLNHLIVTKSGLDCAVLDLTQGASGDERMALAAPEGWRILGAKLGTCSDGGPSQSVSGVVGSLLIRKVTDGCVVDVHASLFAFSSTGQMKTTRLDADGVPIGGMGKELCRNL